jgi:hypothetical protein
MHEKFNTFLISLRPTHTFSFSLSLSLRCVSADISREAPIFDLVPVAADAEAALIEFDCVSRVAAVAGPITERRDLSVAREPKTLRSPPSSSSAFSDLEECCRVSVLG